MASVKAVWQGGVFRPTEPVELPEQTQVEVLIPSPDDDEDPTGWKAAEGFIGFIEDGPEEPIASEHDRWLYGDRRR